jgi:peroxiredoxin
MNRIFFLAACFCSLATSGQNAFHIQGKLDNIRDAGKVFLYYSGPEGSVTDSAVVTDGRYQFSGNVVEPVLGLLLLRYKEVDTGKVIRAINMQRDYVNFFLEAGEIQVTSIDSFHNLKVTGSLSHQAYEALNLQLKEVEDQKEALNREYGTLYQQKDEAGMKKLEARFEELNNASKVIYRAYLTANPGSPIALHAIRQIAGWDIKADEVEPLFALLPEKTKNLPSAKDLMQKVTIARKTGIGQQAMDFTQNDTSGNPVTLSSFRGNYVLIDFWASWCGPCRAENPNVVKAYEQYKGKGFQVIGISLDQANARDKWLKAIHEDQLTWTQVSDLKFWKNAVAVQYGIQAIPQNFLIDPAGKIIAKNLRGEDLVAKLERIFK